MRAELQTRGHRLVRGPNSGGYQSITYDHEAKSYIGATEISSDEFEMTARACDEMHGASAAGRSMELSVDLLANERNQWDQQEADVRRRGVVAVDGARAEQCDALLTPRIELQMARQAVKAA